MSINILDLAKGAVGSQLGPLAGILGESEQNTNSAIGAAVPAILGGLMKKSSSADGASEIFKTLDDYDGGILENLGGLLGGGNHTGLVNSGGGVLDMIFGGNKTSTLGTVARIAGFDDSKMVTLLSVLAPVVMGVLGKQRRSQGLDVSALTNLLSSQKEHLAGHMPGELSSSLGLDDISVGAADQVTGAAASAAPSSQSAGQAVGNAGQPTAGAAGKQGGGLLMALLPLILLGAIAFLGWNFFGPKAKDAGNNVGGAADGLGGMTIPKIELPGFPSQEIGTTFGDLTAAISGIKDVASAEAVIPKVKDAGTMLDDLDLGAIAGGPQKEAVGGLFGELISKLKGALETAYAIPGVEETLKPGVDQFLGRFSVFGL